MLRSIHISVHHRRGRGFTLSEIAMVLSIIGMIMGAIVVAWSKLSLGNQLRLATQELATISNNIRAIYAEQGGVVGTSTALTLAMDQMKVFPFEMRQNPGTASSVIFNSWSQVVSASLGTVFVSDDNCAGAPSGASPQPCFSITFQNLPQNVCINLASATAQPGIGLQAIIINGTLTGDANSPANPLPVPVTTAKTKCTLATAANWVKWIYLLRDNKS